MQDSCKKYQFLARILKEISGLMKFLQDMSAWVEVPEIVSAEQSCFIVLTFFRADSEDMKIISADQLCFSADHL